LTKKVVGHKMYAYKGAVKAKQGRKNEQSKKRVEFIRRKNYQ
jgi:hypothetical protein